MEANQIIKNTPVSEKPASGLVKISTVLYRGFAANDPSVYQGCSGSCVYDASVKLFAGQYHDKESGLHYNWHRYYDPLSDRYTQSDPIGLRGGMNTYIYALANPLKYIDPTGLVYGLSNGGARGQSNMVSRMSKEEISNESIKKVGNMVSNVALVGSVTPCSFACAGLSTVTGVGVSGLHFSDGDVQSGILNLAPGGVNKGVSWFAKESGMFSKYADDLFGVISDLWTQQFIKHEITSGSNDNGLGYCPTGY